MDIYLVNLEYDRCGKIDFEFDCMVCDLFLESCEKFFSKIFGILWGLWVGV